MLKLLRRKARLVVRGYKQQAGIDYFNTFTNVLRYATFRILCAKAASEDWEMNHVDIDTAFLNPELKEEVYMKLPQFIEEIIPGLEGKGAYLKLNMALYGLKQALRAWFDTVKLHFDKLGLKASFADPNLFIGEGVYVLLFVNDMLIIGPKSKTNSIKKKILSK